jgi:hypothetical protein
MADLYAQRLVVLTRRGAPIIPFWVGLSSSALPAVQVGCKSAHFRSARDAGLVGEDDGVDSVAEMELSAIAALLWVRHGRGRLFAGPSAGAREAGATGLHPL